MGKRNPKPSSFKASAEQSSRYSTRSKTKMLEQPIEYFKDEEATQILVGQLKELGLRIKDMTGDGNCLFRALSDQIDGTPGNHAHHRALVCDHLSQNCELYQHFLDESEGSFESYVYRMRREGIYGGNMEIVAFARLHNVDIAVHQPGSPVYTIRGGMNDKETNRPLLHVAYHSWEHYSSVRSLNGPQTGLPDIQIQERKAEITKEPTKMEISIMKTTGCDDLKRIRELMSQHSGNLNKVIDILCEAETEIPEPPSSPPIQSSIPPMTSTKKLTKRQKKINAKANKEKMRTAMVQKEEISLLNTLEI